jgi:hypothetical protein
MGGNHARDVIMPGCSFPVLKGNTSLRNPKYKPVLSQAGGGVDCRSGKVSCPKMLDASA